MTRLANLLLTAALVAATSACRNENTAAAPAPRRPSVAYVPVTPEQVEITGEWIATLDGTVNAQIRPQVSGYLVRRTYNEGAFVHKGDVLFEIDWRPFETALNQLSRSAGRRHSIVRG
jgi:multidrug efflux pump subunit AcrA (membrane-fusion protein)